MLIFAAALWGYSFPGHGLALVLPIPPLFALIAGCLLSAPFSGGPADVARKRRRAAAIWLFLAALAAASLALPVWLAGCSLFPAHPLAKWLVALPWLISGIGMANLWRDLEMPPSRTSSAILVALAATVAAGMLAGGSLDTPWLTAAAAGAVALAAVITAHAAGLARLRLLAAAVAACWAGLLLLRSLGAYLVTQPAVDAAARITHLGWPLAALAGALLLALFFWMPSSVGRWVRLPEINLLVCIWSVGAGLVFAGAAAIGGAARGSVDIYSAAVFLLIGMAVANLLLRPRVSAQALYLVSWVALIGLIGVFIYTVLSAVFAVAVRRFFLVDVVAASLLFGIALALGSLIPAALNLTWEYRPEHLPWLWGAFQVALLLGLGIGRNLSPIWSMNLGAGTCVLVWIVGWQKSDTWIELWRAAPGLEERERITDSFDLLRADNIPLLVRLSLRARRSANYLVLRPLRLAPPFALRCMEAIKRELFDALSGGDAGKRLLPPETPEARDWLNRVGAAPAALVVWTIQQPLRLLRRGWEPAHRLALFILSRISPLVESDKAKRKPSTRWDGRSFRLAVETQRSRGYELTGELWIGPRECSCVISIALDEERQVIKKVFLSRRYVEDRAALGRDPQELQAVLLRAGFRIAVADLKAGRFASRTIDLENEARKLLGAAQDRWCEFRSSSPSLSMGGAYICSLAYPRDPSRGAATVEACRTCNVPELWERCSNLVILGTVGAQRENRLWRAGYFTCPQQEGCVDPQRCLGQQCFTPSIVTRVTWADLGRTD